MDKARIFISYAREDERAVRQLYRKLADAGFIPWMDKADLLPGEQWQPAIKKALRKADFLIICLSSTSVQKRGFVRREFRDALDLWQEKHDDDIYLIPVRLENCDPPDDLAGFQWLDLFEDDEWPRLIQALQEGMRRRGKTPGVQPTVESAPPRRTPEPTLPVVSKHPTNSSPPVVQSQPEPLRVPLNDAPKVVKLVDVDKTSQPQKTRSAVAAPKPKPRKTWSIARVSGLSKAKLVGLGLALFTFASFFFAWLLWNPGGSALPARTEAMRYSLDLENAAGKRVSGLVPLPAGERFRFHFTPSASGYLYLIAPDEEKVLTAFLTKQRVVAGIDFRFPGGGNWINVGAGARFIVIFSPDLLKDLPFLNGDPRRLTREEQHALQDFQVRLASAAPETKATNDSAIVTAQKQSNEPLVFEISVSRQT